MSNLYYSPEEGVDVIGSLDQAGSYEFDTILFVAKDGEVRFACDSGCSCPTPFDDIGWEDAQPVRTRDDVDMAIAQWWSRERSYGGVGIADVTSLARTVYAELSA